MVKRRRQDERWSRVFFFKAEAANGVSVASGGPGKVNREQDANPMVG